MLWQGIIDYSRTYNSLIMDVISNSLSRFHDCVSSYIEMLIYNVVYDCVVKYGYMSVVYRKCPWNHLLL